MRAMANPLTRLLRRWRYGDEIVVVSGLPRSGTSMMMRMLDAGGLPIMTDGLRTADEDNPRGYYEHERVKNLEKDPDKSWVREARGKGLKVISHLLKELPDENYYRVVLMRRDLSEVVASQNKMLVRRGEENPIEDERVTDLYRKHTIHTKVVCRERPNFELLEVRYTDALDDPAACAATVNRFLGNRLDLEGMKGAVDPNLWRNRADQLR